jgi:DME family drug/metabolite transporter
LVVYLGLVPTALAYLCYCAGIARCRTAVTGLVASMIEPLLAALLASLLLGETVLPITAAGCGILLAAIVLLWQGERPPAPRIAEA